jgi:hypothetical protein
MTILQKLLQSCGGYAARGWRRFGHGNQAVGYTEAWQHETFAEEQARWERRDPEYARICEAVRQANERGGEASVRADEAKAEWDARVATQRKASDDAQRATFAIESNHSVAPGIMPEPVRVHDEPAATIAPRGERQAARLRLRGPATRHPLSSEPTKLEVE